MQSVADFVFPDLCLGCRQLVAGGLCRDCLGGLVRLPAPFCRTCGAPVKTRVLQCRDCRGRGFAFDRARQAFAFESVLRRAIHDLKYRSHRSIAGPLALALAELAEQGAPATDGNRPAVTWVPSGARRLRERGFDHARLLAEAVAGKLGLVCAGLLAKSRETDPQVKLDLQVRRHNLDGAFECRLPAPERVIVVDDVFTTGATASEAARALKAQGAKHVTVISLARTLPLHGPGGAKVRDDRRSA